MSFQKNDLVKVTKYNPPRTGRVMRYCHRDSRFVYVKMGARECRVRVKHVEAIKPVSDEEWDEIVQEPY